MRFVALLMFLVGCTSTPKNPWSQVQGPSQRSAASIGKYDAGCIAGARRLTESAEGLIVMRPSRKRYYGHTTLVRFVEEFSKKVSQEKHSPVLIGDLAQARGGPMPLGHASHQTGLDVDIWYLKPYRAWLDKNELETMSAESYIGEGQWTPREDRLIQLAAEFSDVERIFVHPLIKKNLCSRFSKRVWMRKVRPWYKHHDHFHVRLACPIDSPDCQRQSDTPEGDGCDSTLEWWFSEEAKLEEQKKVESEGKMPALPEQCAAVLSE